MVVKKAGEWELFERFALPGRYVERSEILLGGCGVPNRQAILRRDRLDSIELGRAAAGAISSENGRHGGVREERILRDAERAALGRESWRHQASSAFD